jgi:LacI family transcriptional regulator, gluconate utilization system Gnt-I transcriptional repressor
MPSKLTDHQIMSADAQPPYVRRRFGTNAVTMADVAKVAGVSAQTVSRVMREPQGCMPQTCERVHAAIRSTGYVQNLAASHLASNRSMTIAVVLPVIAASIFAETVQGLSNVLLPEGYQIVIGHTDYDLEREEAVVRSLLGRRPDAFFLVGTKHTDATRALLARAQVPIVESWSWVERPIDQLVGFSNVKALVETVAYAKKAGYKRPAFVGSMQVGDYRAQERLEGFEKGMSLHYPGRTRRKLIVHDLPNRLSSGEQLLQLARTKFPDSDLLVFSSDLFASGALLACQRLGIKVPDSLAIMGFGDYEIARELVPALTTVAVPTTQIGERAAALILQRLRGEQPRTRKLDLGFKLVVRQSA